MFPLFFRMLVKFLFHAVTGDSSGGNRVHGIPENADNLRGQNCLEDINALFNAGLISGGHRSIFDVGPGPGSKFFNVGKEGLGILSFSKGAPKRD
jgi:hypothetical protein